MIQLLKKRKNLLITIGALLVFFGILLYFVPLSHAFYFTLLASLVVFIAAKLHARKGIEGDIHEVAPFRVPRRTMPELTLRSQPQSDSVDTAVEVEPMGPVPSLFVQEVWEQKDEQVIVIEEAEPEVPLLEPSDFVKRVWREAALREKREEDALSDPDTLLVYTPHGFVPQILEKKARKTIAKKTKKTQQPTGMPTKKNISASRGKAKPVTANTKPRSKKVVASKPAKSAKKKAHSKK